VQTIQTYAEPSSATIDQQGMHMHLSTDVQRPGVFLDALVDDSLSYARVMLALHDLVSSDIRPPTRDHSAYQAWVQDRYYEELDAQVEELDSHLHSKLENRERLLEQIRPLEERIESLRSAAFAETDNKYRKAERKYFDWLKKHDYEGWYVLDPVVSVHPDCVMFEAFSVDESSYGRVTVPMSKLRIEGTTAFGTTNIDFSRSLADEFERVRSYRRAWLRVGTDQVVLATREGSAVEKKIDLPLSWVRGFLQVQAASAQPSTDLTLSAGVVADVLSTLKRHRERSSPRSLRFELSPGERPWIIVEPWNIAVREPSHLFDGDSAMTIRVWGRRRLFFAESLLPHVEKIQVRLLGTGMPSFWSLECDGFRFDIGLSGWTDNDWSESARFDVLAASHTAPDQAISQAEQLLREKLQLTSGQASAETGISRHVINSAMQVLCARGLAMYDSVHGTFRWRQLLPAPLLSEAQQEDRFVQKARRLANAKAVVWNGEPKTVENGVVFEADVRDEQEFRTSVEMDLDGRVRSASCGCKWYRAEGLRKGPCAHLLVTAALSSRRILEGYDLSMDAPDI
jgi:hypothetical protein